MNSSDISNNIADNNSPQSTTNRTTVTQIKNGFNSQSECRSIIPNSGKMNLKTDGETFELAYDIQYQVDFEIVEKSIWNFLVGNFGGGPTIIRRFSMPATPGASSILLDPIWLEMFTRRGTKYKTCAPDWKLIDLKKFLCRNINIENPNDYHFYSYDKILPVEEQLTVGEYVRIHKTRIRLRQIDHMMIDAFNSSIMRKASHSNHSNASSNFSNHKNPHQYQNPVTNSVLSQKNQETLMRSNFLSSTLPHHHPQKFPGTNSKEKTCKPVLSTINMRSGSMFKIMLPKPVGLINLGNTCFFNAAIQCIIRVKPLIDFVFSNDFEYSINKSNPLGSGGEIAMAFHDFIQEMSSPHQRTAVMNPQKFRSALIKKYHCFANYGQHDSQEVVGAILDGLHEDLNRAATSNRKPSTLLTTNQAIPNKYTYATVSTINSSKSNSPNENSIINSNINSGMPNGNLGASQATCNVKNDTVDSWTAYKLRNDSIIVDLFQGALSSIVNCNVCGYNHYVLDPFMFLSLPVPNRLYPATTLNECLASFCHEDVLDSNNLWKCPKCEKLVNARKKIEIKYCPPILIVHLKRFYGSGFFARKLEADVKYPSELDLSRFCQDDTAKYRLFGVIFHTGGLTSGHYTAATIDPASGKWYNFNDSSASQMPESAAYSPRAYILFYQREIA